MVAAFNNEDVLGGRYRLDDVIAEGGMAVVWRATDLQLRREVAVKVLKQNVASDPVVAERFRREAIALAALHHRSIVPVYDCLDSDGQVVLVMQLIRGLSLRDLLDKTRRETGSSTLSVHTTIHIGKEIAAALAVVHASDIVHRDIKPGNIMLTPGGHILLTDFGIAKGVKSDQDDNTDLTRPDLMMGTAKYLSPEQVQGRGLDGRADIYALGLVLYECLAGHAPFRGENEQQVAIARLQRDPTPLGGLRADVPGTVIDVIHRMLRRKPENRFQSAADVVTALDGALAFIHDAETPSHGGLPGTSRPRTPRPAPPDPLMGKPRQEAARPPGEPRAAPRETTPQGTPRADGALPSRQRSKPGSNMVPVVAVLVFCAVMAVLLWNGLRNSKSAVPVVDAEPPATLAAVSLASIRSYDPNGDDGNENETLVPLLRDANPATAWTTVCYGDRYFGAKGGVGLVMELSGTGIGTVTADFAGGPWNAEVYASDSASVPARIEDWGKRVGHANDTGPARGTFAITAPGRFVLLLLREAGTSTSCSAANPYQGIISEVGFTSAP